MMNKLLSILLALVLALSLTAGIAENEGVILLGTSGFSIVAPGYQPGEITAEDTDESQVGYYKSEESPLDFDVYQWVKADGETLESTAAAEAAEYGAEAGSDVINGITVYFDGAKEEYEGVEYDTETYLMENGDIIAEIVFWLDDEACQDEMGTIIETLAVDTPVKIDEGGTEIVLGTSHLKLTTKVPYAQGELSAEDTDENQVAYYHSEESLIDFDVYQWAKAEGETAEGIANEEAEEYGAEEVFEAIVNDIVLYGYYADEEYEGQTYQTVTFVTEDGNDFVEVVFWLDGENAPLEMTDIVATMTRF